MKSLPDTKNSKSSSALRFLPGVEGLRALAVVAVLLYHVDLNLLPGGTIKIIIEYLKNMNKKSSYRDLESPTGEKSLSCYLMSFCHRVRIGI